MRRAKSETLKNKNDALPRLNSSIAVQPAYSKSKKEGRQSSTLRSFALATTVIFSVGFIVLAILPTNLGETVSKNTEITSHFQVMNDSESTRNLEMQKDIEMLSTEIHELRENLKEVFDLMQNKEKLKNTNVHADKPEMVVETPAKKSKKTISVFFNTYQKLNDTKTSFSVIYDQVKKLNLASSIESSTVYFSRFGDLTNWPYTKCANKGKRKCVEIAAQKEGDEVITLQYLHEFCAKNKDDRVVYIHSKGTHTHSWNNRILKNILMKATMSEECLATMGTNGMSCNTCSSQFSGFPAHYPGNMWVAECEYINKLIPPKEFAERKQEVANLIINATHNSVFPDGTIDPENFETILDDETTLHFHNKSWWMARRPSWLGLDRFSMEHWLGSHPEMEPCDVFSPKDGVPVFSYDTMKQKRVFSETLTAKLQEAPGVNFAISWTHPYKLHPWFKAGGKEFEYMKLYTKLPPKSSWFYKYWEGTKKTA